MEEKTIFKYMIISRVGTCKRTLIYGVYTLKYVTLGKIFWCNSWRQYCFYPDSGIQFNHSCLSDISEFLKELNKEHRNKNKEEK